MKLVEDPSLLVGFQQGKQESLRVVYLHYAPQLYAYLRKGFSFSSGSQWYRVAGILNPVEQENLVQDTFVRCFDEKARTSYDGKRPFLPYLQRICRNIFLGEKRKAWRELLEEQPNDDKETLVESSAQEQLEHQELIQLLRDYLESCDNREREVFQAIYEEGDAQQQAAERLGLGRTQVRTTLVKLRQGLLQHLKDSGYLEQLQANPTSYHSLAVLYPWLHQLLQDLTNS